jgi:amidohydrolase
MVEQILNHAYAIEAELTENRRTLHKNPELGTQEHETSRFVQEKLEALGIEFEKQKSNTGVVALLRGTAPGRTVALRADMDALPIEEQSELEYRSQNKNVMHACGHDAHTAILLGAASILSRLKGDLRGNVKFLFQPGEEIGFGAAAMINEGVLEDPKVDAAFALHVDPLLESGTVGWREGPICALGGGFEIEVIGKGGHSAIPHLCINPILVAAEIVQALQTVGSVRMNPSEPFVLTVATINGGSKANIIPDTATITGTVRGLDKALIEESLKHVGTIAEQIAKAHGAQCGIQLRSWGVPLTNDPAMTGIVREAGIEVAGREKVIRVPPYLVGEDFTLFAQRVPASFAFLGVGFAGAENFPLHHSRFRIDEKALPVGAALLANTAVKFLNGAATDERKGNRHWDNYSTTD